MHKRMIMLDDSEHKSMLRNYMGSRFYVIDNSSRDPEAAAAEVSSIIKNSLLRRYEERLGALGIAAEDPK
ncbi:MAG: hypothetical protein QXN59_02850, partial [Candidatus Micrarchaeaceae archaeon]